MEAVYIGLEVKNGILYEYLSKTITLDIAKKTVQNRKKFCKGNAYHSLIDCLNICSLKKAARDYLSYDEGTENIIAGALITNWTFKTTLANFFLKVTKPKIPATLFTSEKKALEWLGQFVQINILTND